MKISFLKSKIRSLRKYDLFKAIIDILLPDLMELGDYDPNMKYRKGDKVYYYNKMTNKSYILEAKENIQPSSTINLDQWSIVTGNSLPNSNLIKKLQINNNNNLMYEGSVLNNVHVSIEEPSMNERDLWFSLTKQDIGDDGEDNPELPDPDAPQARENEVIIKNMIVQDDQPVDNNYLWGDLEEEEETLPEEEYTETPN